MDINKHMRLLINLIISKVSISQGSLKSERHRRTIYTKSLITSFVNGQRDVCNI